MKELRAGESLVCFLGYRSPHKGEHQIVSSSSLETYNTDEEEDRWSRSRMQKFQKHIRKTQNFDNVKCELHLKTEECYLALVLSHVKEREQEYLQDQKKPVVPDDSLETPDKEEKGASPLSSAARVFQPLSPRQRETNVAPKNSSSSSQKAVGAEPEQPSREQVTRLRAGDCVQYYEPHMVAGPDALRQAQILNVFSKRSRTTSIVLELDSHRLLPLDSKVKLMKRWKRGKLYDIPGAVWLDLQKFSLDVKNNGKILQQGPSLAERMSVVVDQTNAEIERGVELAYQNDCSPINNKAAEKKAPSEPVHSESRRRTTKRKLEEPVTPNPETSTKTQRGSTASNIRGKKTPQRDLKPTLQARLQQVEASRRRHRCDLEQINVLEASLTAAMELCHFLEKQMNENQQMDALVQELAEEFEVDEMWVWNFLKGNPNNLLSAKKLGDLTALVGGYLQKMAANDK